MKDPRVEELKTQGPELSPISQRSNNNELSKKA